MASYIDNNLAPGEQVLYRAKVSILSLIPLLILGLFTITLIIGIFIIAYALIVFFTTELAITNKRVVAKVGFLSRKTIEMSLQKTESIQIEQGLFGRLMNYGSILVSGAGAYVVQPVKKIDNPLAFRHAFLAAQEQASKPAPGPGSEAIKGSIEPAKV